MHVFNCLLSFVCPTKERSKEKRTAGQHPSARPCVSLETPPRLRRFQLDSAAAQSRAFPFTPRGARGLADYFYYWRTSFSCPSKSAAYGSPV